ncbi:MAG: glycoside hydrolase family 3 protein, partial [Chthoniobacterales bacterium]
MILRNVIVIVTLAALAACQRAPQTSAEKAEALLAKMTLDEKIGQMTQVDSQALDGREQEIATSFLGSILSGGNSNPPTGSSAQEWKDYVAKLDAFAAQTRLKIPVIYGIDAVHGNNNITSATILPHNIGLGATRDPQAVEKAARVTAEEVSAIGVDWAFAPCVAVAQDERWGRTYESFGEDPTLVALMGAAAVRGLQSTDLASPDAILSCTKHFLGDGGTAGGKDQGDTQGDLATLKKIHLPGYVEAIRAGTDSIMVSYSSWNGLKMHAQRALITDLLKGDLGFKGFVVSDWAAIDQINKGDYKDCVGKAINAGIDMVMIPHAVTEAYAWEPPTKRHNTFHDFIKDLRELVAEGKVPMSRIDDAVRRILTVKYKLGLFDGRKGSPQLFAAIGSPQHREVARDCVRKSLVLLQNRNNVLPLSKQAKRIGVTGRGADNIEIQCGGWTLDWQSMNGMKLGGGTTILAALKAVVSKNTEVVFSPDGTGLAGCDVVLAIVGEGPYAEYKGDRADLSLDAADLQTISTARASGAPVVTVLISGRPLLIGPVLDQSDGVIAAWLPGSEGAGVTDVLFGDYKPTGKLPCSWPRTMAQIPINMHEHAGVAGYNPQFPYGFGLTYK